MIRLLLILLLSATVASARPPPLAFRQAWVTGPDLVSGLVAYYKLDESNSTTTVTDYSPKARNQAAFANTDTISVPAKVGNGFQKAPTGTEFVITPNTSDYPTGDCPWTVAYWLYPLTSNTFGFGHVAWGYTATKQQADIYIQNAKIHCDQYSADWNTGVLIATGAWTHIAVVYDGKSHILYTNGYQAAASTSYTNFNLTIGNKHSFLGGATNSQTIMDEFRIYTRALTNTDIRALPGF